MPARKDRLVNQVAELEGWGIFESDSRGTEIERDDESDVFACDDAARAHVVKLAEAGSKIHQEALKIVDDAQALEHADQSIPPRAVPAWSEIQEKLLAAAQAVVNDAERIEAGNRDEHRYAVDAEIFADLKAVVQEIHDAAVAVIQGGEVVMMILVNGEYWDLEFRLQVLRMKLPGMGTTYDLPREDAIRLAQEIMRLADRRKG